MTRLATAPAATGKPHFDQAHTPLVLCIDDDPDISWAIEMRLKNYDVVVRRAFHGMHGIWEAIRKRPDLILMDLAMPNGDGSYVVRCLRGSRETAGVPIVVLTGMRDPSLPNRMIRLGADAYITKPVAFDELKHQMSRFIDLRPKAKSDGDADVDQPDGHEGIDD